MTQLTLDPVTGKIGLTENNDTPSVLWDQAVQEAVVETSLGPTIASRAYAIIHTAMFDAWAAYDSTAIATQLGDDLQRPEIENTDENKTEAMSYAAYGVLKDLFPNQVEIFAELMESLGLDPNNTTTDTTTAAGIGNVTAATLLAVRHEDGSNQLGLDPNGTQGVPYSDISGYQPINNPETVINMERWTPERVPIDNPNGPIQQFLTPHWGDVIPFANIENLTLPDPEPFLLGEGTVDLFSKTITLEDGTVLDINKSLIGTVINPGFIEQAEEVVEISANLTDEEKMVAEFWENGGGTSFPPGTWMTFGQFVSARDEHTLDEDAQLFFTLANAEMDAGIATWGVKVDYDYTRPVRAIRELGKLGLIGEFDAKLGGYAIEAWAGPGEGTQKILATDFITYQTPGTNPSPPFAEYVSGHSTFSAAGATVLKLFAGEEFGGEITINTGESRFEPGITPTAPVTLEWETFEDAAAESGISRLYGGIHFEDGNLNGQNLGAQIGENAFEEAEFYINGGLGAAISLTPKTLKIVEGLNQEAVFEVNLTEATNTATVVCCTEDISTQSSQDYTDTNEILTFNPGETTKQITIPIINNNANELNETFKLILENPSNAVISNGEAIITITDTQAAKTTTKLSSRVENLTLTGVDNINGTGNNNSNILTGNSGNNRLFGLNGNDKLKGNGGNDLLDGGTGADTMRGGLGNDTYIINSSRDTVKESAGAGNDLIKSNQTYALGNNQEKLILTGTRNRNATGNNLNNNIKGNSGNNKIEGKGGNDTLIGNNGNDQLVGNAGNDQLTGGAGADRFIFNFIWDQIDSITDFKATQKDQIRIDASSFGGLLPENRLLPSGQFVIGAKASDANDRFIYNHGALFYDVDGVGGAAQVKIATLIGAPHLSANNIYLF